MKFRNIGLKSTPENVDFFQSKRSVTSHCLRLPTSFSDWIKEKHGFIFKWLRIAKSIFVVRKGMPEYCDSCAVAHSSRIDMRRRLGFRGVNLAERQNRFVSGLVARRAALYLVNIIPFVGYTKKQLTKHSWHGFCLWVFFVHVATLFVASCSVWVLRFSVCLLFCCFV